MALTDHGLIQNDDVFIDGTKVEADANKCSFTWRRAVEKYHARLREKAVKLYEELGEERVLQAMAPEPVESAEGMELIAQDIEKEVTKLSAEIEQEPKIIKGGSVRKRRRRFLKNFAIN